MHYKTALLVIVLIALASVTMAQSSERGIAPPAPPVASQRGFGEFLCTGPGCWNGPFMPPFGGGPALWAPDTLSRSGHYYGADSGDKVSAATWGADGGYGLPSIVIPWARQAAGVLPIETPVLTVGLPDYDGRPNPEVLEISFSGTPFVAMDEIPGSDYGTVGLGMFTNCLVLENTQCDCTWDPAIDDSQWDTTDAKVCTGITRSGDGDTVPFTYVRPWFFSVYPQGTGLTLTFAVSYHGFMQVDKECNWEVVGAEPRCAAGDPMLIAKVRTGLGGYGLSQTGTADPPDANFMKVGAPHLMVNY